MNLNNLCNKLFFWNNYDQWHVADVLVEKYPMVDKSKLYFHSGAILYDLKQLLKFGFVVTPIWLIDPKFAINFNDEMNNFDNLTEINQNRLQNINKTLTDHLRTINNRERISCSQTVTTYLKAMNNSKNVSCECYPRSHLKYDIDNFHDVECRIKIID